MKKNSLAIIAIALWVVGAAVVGFSMIKGNVSSIEENRQVVSLTPDEKAKVLSEMRTLLGTTHGIVNGLAAGDNGAVADAAKSGGMEIAVDLRPALMMKLPA